MYAIYAPHVIQTKFTGFVQNIGSKINQDLLNIKQSIY